MSAGHAWNFRSGRVFWILYDEGFQHRDFRPKLVGHHKSVEQIPSPRIKCDSKLRRIESPHPPGVAMLPYEAPSFINMGLVQLDREDEANREILEHLVHGDFGRGPIQYAGSNLHREGG